MLEEEEEEEEKKRRTYGSSKFRFLVGRQFPCGGGPLLKKRLDTCIYIYIYIHIYISLWTVVAFARRRIMRNLLTDSRILERKDAARSSAYSDGWGEAAGRNGRTSSE